MRTPGRLIADQRTLAFEPHLDGLPPLPAVDWDAAGLPAPTALETPDTLPHADVVLIAWTTYEWAATHHIFCDSGVPMTYADTERDPFPGWVKDGGVPDASERWDYWGYYRLIEVAGRRVLLYKSNTHLDYPGRAALTALVERLIAEVKPGLILSSGTAGGANAHDHVGTVVVVKAASLYEGGQPAGGWPRWSSRWQAPAGAFAAPGLQGLLMAIPITTGGLQELADQLNASEHSGYTLDQLDPLGLNRPDAVPAIRDFSAGAESLLTASSFVVGTTDERLAVYACVEMDDAIVAEACSGGGVEYGSVRNLSDPAQSPQLPSSTQGSWGKAVCHAFGVYTSFNGALTARAALG
jgi:nucleoside phosphorylase